jgi:peptidoglycan hydrolase CwlO-like protein
LTNEKFQEIVLIELRDLKEGQKRLEKGQGSLEERQTKLETGQNKLEERLGKLEEGQTRLEESYTKLEGSYNRLEESYTKLEDSYTRLDERQTRFEKKLDIVYDQTVFLSECYTDLNKKLDTLHNDFKSIHQIIGEHEISIRTLRRKDFENNKEFYDAKIREKNPID